jgi:hypothetical protein
MSQPWTIDAIAHALPHPENRQAFWRDVNLTPVDRLPEVIARWQQLAEQWQASRPSLDGLAAYAREHGGELPEGYADDGDTDAWLAQLAAGSGAGTNAA